MRPTPLFFAVGLALSLSAVTMSAVATSAAPTPKASSKPAGTVSIALPADHGAFKDAPGADLARARCLVCHSAEYVYMQPPLTKQTWTNEIKKMKNVFGAVIDDADVAPLVDYLVGQNGKP